MDFKIKSNLKRFRNEFNLIKNRKKEICLLGTMPKSGTWLVQYFFWSLKNFILDEDININNFNFEKRIKNYLTINKSYILIGHASCPGYTIKKDLKFGEKWKKINYWTDGYNFLDREIGNTYNPVHNKNIKIMYIYRNPLTQIYSSYNYNKNHKSKFQRNISKLPLSKFCFEVSAIDSYIKQFHTYKVMQRHYPDNIKLLSFEELVENKEENFLKICDFFNIFKDQGSEINLIQKAIEFTNKENLKKVEKVLGHSLANDHINYGSHFQEYDKKNYKDYFSDADLKNIEAIFSEFGYSLKDFKNLEKK